MNFNMKRCHIFHTYVPFWHIDAELNVPYSHWRWRQFLSDVIDDDDFPLIDSIKYSRYGLTIEVAQSTPRISKLLSRIRFSYLCYYRLLCGGKEPNFQYFKEELF